PHSVYSFHVKFIIRILNPKLVNVIMNPSFVFLENLLKRFFFHFHFSHLPDLYFLTCHNNVSSVPSSPLSTTQLFIILSWAKEPVHSYRSPYPFNISLCFFTYILLCT